MRRRLARLELASLWLSGCTWWDILDLRTASERAVLGFGCFVCGFYLVTFFWGLDSDLIF